MSEKRFTVKSIKNNHYQIAENDLKMLSNEVVDYMNLSSDAIFSLQKKVVEQQATIEQLRQSQDVKEFSALFNQSIALKREIKDLKEENEYFRKSRDKWKTKALQKDEQLQDCDKDCFNCRFYNKVCDFCTKFHIYTMTSGDKDE